MIKNIPHSPIVIDPILSYLKPGIAEDSLQVLKKGQVPWSASLDLRGFEVDEAHTALSEFIFAQIKSAARYILITHGKDEVSREFTLKNLINEVLPQFDKVLAFHSAAKKDGGLEAVYVLLQSEEYHQKSTVSYYKTETKLMERTRRLAEQQGERRLAPVKAREHSNAEQTAMAAEGDLQNSISQHPLLNNQRFDGVDAPLSPEPPLNSTARTDFDNQRREQEMEKQLRLGHMPKFSSTPTPRKT